MVRAVYFSANGTTNKVICTIAGEAARRLGIPWEPTDFTLPGARTRPLAFRAGELIIFGTWISAGRVPNLLLPYLEQMKGDGALAVPVVLFGSRHYEDGLIELRDLLVRSGSFPIAAGAFVGEHAFSAVIGKGRPDQEDLAVAGDFGRRVATMLLSKHHKKPGTVLWVPGTEYPYRGYYQPLDPAGDPVRFLKAVPETASSCIDCKLCVDVCPMGAVDRNDVSLITGRCIKCCACVRRCPVSAKQFTDPGFIAHRTMLEQTLTRRPEPELYF